MKRMYESSNEIPPTHPPTHSRQQRGFRKLRAKHETSFGYSLPLQIGIPMLKRNKKQKKRILVELKAIVKVNKSKMNDYHIATR